MSEQLKQHFSSVESSLVISMGVISGCVAALQPILLGGLLERGQLSAVQMGQAATAEAFGMALAATLAAIFLSPKRLRHIAALALLIALLANALTAFSEGLGVILLRGLNGLCSGTLLWILLGLLARSPEPGRAFAIYVTSQAVVSFVFSLLITHGVTDFAGAAGDYGLFSAVNLLLLILVSKIPAEYAADESAPAYSMPPLTGILGLVASGLFIASIMGFWVYVLPVGKALGYAAEHVTGAVNMAIGAQIAAGLSAIALATCLRPFAACFLGTLLVAACAFVFTNVDHVIAIYGSLIVFSFVWMFVPPFQLPLVIELDPSLRSALFIGTAQLSGVTLGPIVAAQFVTETSSVSSVYSCYGLAALAIGALLSSRARSEKA